MQKIKFDKVKYGKELLIDTVDMTDFDRDINIALPDFYILGCVKKGEGQIKIGHSKVSVSDNMFIFIAAGTHTDIEKCTFEEATWIFFEGEFLEYFFNEKFFYLQVRVFPWLE